MPSTAYCLVCLHPTMRKKDCRLRVLGVHKQQRQGMYRNFLFLVRSAVESSSARRMTLPVYQLESFRNVNTDNPADLVVRISRFGAVPSVRLNIDLVAERACGHGPPDCGTLCGVAAAVFGVLRSSGQELSVSSQVLPQLVVV
jgi:hypothetical protein